MKHLPVDDEGLLLLCAAVLTQARADYITGDYQMQDSIRKFVRSPLFELYCFGSHSPDPETVIQTWDRERRERIAQRIRIFPRMER